ncbi:MAG: hypothetical protein H6523_13115 [Mycolicibacterium sp.]|nr:hypothetical protein [Mycolicibacterium sp.]
MNVRELMAILATADPDAPVLVSGYEGGFTHISSASVCEMQELDRGVERWLGEFDTPEKAAELIAPPKPGSWPRMTPPPTLVGDPILALVISRSGR